MIELKNVTKTYDTMIFENINFQLRDRGITFIYGKSGCGKSTLLNMLAGLDLDYQGDIIIEDKKYTSSIQENLRYQYIAYLNQKDDLIQEMTVQENLNWIQSMSHSHYDIHHYIERFHLKDILHEYPHELSGGEYSLMSLLKNILWQRKYLLLDEPNAKLDAFRKKVLRDVLLELSKDYSILVVSHDLDFMDIADDIFRFEHHHLIQEKQGHYGSIKVPSVEYHFNSKILILKNFCRYPLRYLFSTCILFLVFVFSYAFLQMGSNLYGQVEQTIKESRNLDHIQGTAKIITQDMIDEIAQVSYIDSLDYQFYVLFPSASKDDPWMTCNDITYTFKDYPIKYAYRLHDQLDRYEICLSKDIIENFGLHIGDKIDLYTYLGIGFVSKEDEFFQEPVLKPFHYLATIKEVDEDSSYQVYLSSTLVDEWIRTYLAHDQKRLVSTNRIQLFLKPGTTFDEVQSMLSRYHIEATDLYELAKGMVKANMSTYDILRVYGVLTLMMGIIFIFVSLKGYHEYENRQHKVLTLMGISSKQILKMQWIQNLIPIVISGIVGITLLWISIPSINQYFYQQQLFYEPLASLQLWIPYTFEHIQVIRFHVGIMMILLLSMTLVIIGVKTYLYKKEGFKSLHN